MLWIAFIFQYLWDTKQPNISSGVSGKGCELLSFFSIFGIQNNPRCHRIGQRGVVNCFHFSVSLGYKTTMPHFTILSHTLWIAFIFQYLWDTKQQYNELTIRGYSCELLSFFSIFGIQNNNPKKNPINEIVVNCFHFSVSLGYKTTLSLV